MHYKLSAGNVDITAFLECKREIKSLVILATFRLSDERLRKLADAIFLLHYKIGAVRTFLIT